MILWIISILLVPMIFGLIILIDKFNLGDFIGVTIMMILAWAALAVLFHSVLEAIF